VVCHVRIGRSVVDDLRTANQMTEITEVFIDEYPKIESATLRGLADRIDDGEKVQDKEIINALGEGSLSGIVKLKRGGITLPLRTYPFVADVLREMAKEIN